MHLHVFLVQNLLISLQAKYYLHLYKTASGEGKKNEIITDKVIIYTIPPIEINGI